MDTGVPLGALSGTFALLLFDQQRAAAEKQKNCAAVEMKVWILEHLQPEESG